MKRMIAILLVLCLTLPFSRLHEGKGADTDSDLTQAKIDRILEKEEAAEHSSRTVPARRPRCPFSQGNGCLGAAPAINKKRKRSC
jgi:hypothetical protein